MVRVRAGLGLGLTVDIQIGTIMTINKDPSPNLIGRQVDRLTSRQVDNSVLAVQINYIYRAAYPLETSRLQGSFSHHALSPCISAWTIPTYPFIYFGNIDLSTCRLVDLSTCRPSAIVNNKDPVRVSVRLGFGLVCG